MALRTFLDLKTEVVIPAAAGPFAFPTAVGDGVAIDADWRAKAADASNPGAWRRDGGSQVDAAVFIETDAARAFSAGLGLYGWRTDRAKWYLLGQLNNGNAIATLGANTGWSCTVQFAGVYDRLAIGSLAAAAVTIPAGTASFRIAQVKTTETL
jgi:hypothetical protein